MDFYTKELNFNLDGLWPEQNPEWCSLIHGAVNIMFYKDNQNSNSNLAMPGHLYFYTENVLELHKKLAAKTEVLWGPEVYHYGMREFAIREVNGYTIAFGEPTDDPPTCHE